MPDDDATDPLVVAVQRHVTPERWSELSAQAHAQAQALDADDELAGLRFLDLLSADEEDAAVSAVVGELAVELRASPTPAVVTDRVLGLLENQFRCRLPAEAVVMAPISETPFDPADPEAGTFLTIEVAVSTPQAAGRFQLTTPCETEAQRTLLSTPGNRLPVRVSARDPGRITLDLGS